MNTYELEHFPTFDEARADDSGRYLILERGLFDTVVCKRRLRISIEPFLRDAYYRARIAGTTAYAHAVGLGLGAWWIDAKQVGLMVDTYADIPSFLSTSGFESLRNESY